jgi:hypothetical protein
MTLDKKISSIPASLRGLDQVTHLDSVVLKQHYVTTMFEIIAPRYNRFGASGFRVGQIGAFSDSR